MIILEWVPTIFNQKTKENIQSFRKRPYRKKYNRLHLQDT